MPCSLASCFQELPMKSADAAVAPMRAADPTQLCLLAKVRCRRAYWMLGAACNVTHCCVHSDPCWAFLCQLGLFAPMLVAPFALLFLTPNRLQHTRHSCPNLYCSTYWLAWTGTRWRLLLPPVPTYMT